MSKHSCRIVGVMSAVAVLIVFLVSFLTVPVTAANTVPTPDHADLNGDGEVNTIDAKLLYQYAAGVTGTLTEEQKQLVDFEQNGLIDMKCAKTLFQYAAGITPGSTTTTETTTTTTKPSGDIDLMVWDNIHADPSVSVTKEEDGSWTLESTDGVSGVNIDGCGTYDAQALPYMHLNIVSSVSFKVAFYDAANSKWMTSDGDFYPNFNTVGGAAAPAGTYRLSLFTQGCYTWDGSKLPETVQMSTIRIAPKEAGKMTVSAIKLSSSEVPIMNKGVLFVGNSFVFYNNMTTTLQNMFTQAGKDIYVDSVVQGGAYLNEYADPTSSLGIALRKKLAEADWDYVVFQDQSSNPAEDRQDFLTAAQTLCSLVGKDSQVLFYQTWAYRDGSDLLKDTGMTYQQMYEALRSAYQTAATMYGGQCVPVGDAFAKMHDTSPQVMLYASDDLHPSIAGTYLIACEFFRAVTGVLPGAEITPPAGVSDEVAALIRTACA